MRFVISCDAAADGSGLLFGTRRFACVRVTREMLDTAPLTPRARAVLRGHLPTLNMSDLPTPGAIGCSLSHIALWRRLVRDMSARDDDVMVVFEDDAQLTRSPAEIEAVLARAKRLPYDVFFLGLRFPLETAFETRTERADDEFRWVHAHFWETHAYAIRKRAARKLLAHALPIDTQIDAYMCTQMRTQGLRFLCHNATLARQRRSILDSTIQTRAIFHQCAACRLPPALRSGVFAIVLLATLAICISTLAVIATRR